jgi:hypothetical protein
MAAAHADVVVFLSDGRIAGQLADPTAEKVLEALAGGSGGASGASGAPSASSSLAPQPAEGG